MPPGNRPIERELVTEVVGVDFRLAFVPEAAFGQVGSHLVRVLVPLGGPVDITPHHNGVLVVNVFIVGVVHFILEFGVEI